MKTQHTPGPWYIVNSLNPNHSFEIFGADVYHVARFEKDGIETELANARLIAAAPELLLLAQLQEVYDETEGFYYNSVWYQKSDAQRKLTELRKAIIAKATGEKEGLS